jgi:hypothetical protein
MMVSFRETRDELSPNDHVKTDDEFKGFAGMTLIIAESPHATVESGKIKVNAGGCVVAVGDLHEGSAAEMSSRRRRSRILRGRMVICGSGCGCNG